MPVLDGLTGIVFVAILGSLFVITCFISSIKAVRDRIHIKKRMAMRISNQQNQTKEVIYDITPREIQIPCSSKLHKSPSATCSNGTSDQHDKIESSVYLIDAGVNNLTFQLSNTDIKDNEKHSETDISISYNGKAPRRTKSHDISCQRDRHLDHLSSECLSIKKLMRSHSYELAVYENSWMPTGIPTSQKSVPILKVYNIHEDGKCQLKSLEVAFENKAYDQNDFKIS